MRLLLLAPPGAGSRVKGTQGERLAVWFGARHIAAGDLLRAETRAGGLRNKMLALDFATQAQQMKAIGGQPDYALGSFLP